MKTSFTEIQLARPDIAEADKILGTCQHFGFCTSGCPTYTLLHDENDGPRGRIDLIKEMLEQGGSPSPETVGYIDRCLSCMSCMTTCAVKVDYMHLVDIGRAYIEENYQRPWRERLVRGALGYALPRPGLFRIMLGAGRLAARFEKWVPPSLRHMTRLVPAAPQGALASRASCTVYPARAEKRWRVAMLAGCVQPVLSPHINDATIRVLTRMGCEVVVPPLAGCCGSLNLHMGKRDAALRFAAANIRAWLAEMDGLGLDAIVVNASGCGTTVKDYGHMFSGDAELAEAARRVSSIAVDISEWLQRIDADALDEADAAEKAQLPPYKVAYHDACSLRNAQKVTVQPRALMRKAGFQVVDVAESHFCCGSAGTYNMLQPRLAQQLGTRKAANIERVQPQIIAAGNIGCISQIRLYSGIPIVHTVELLDWAHGGPVPPALQGVHLETPEPLAAEPKQTSTTEAPIHMHQDASAADDNDVGVW
ncbi:glycolate oxidase subunit GlcF [Pusillimonas noertemannii]|uniref:glycolate oxidase subunit GlcF n=1 Tax=Pusillimonas noertemannii TaxID=305977 RepID=UPI00031D8A11|nr:glycolate oxidase subunit GlcF [Pusillimonas noertemannii]